MSLATLEVVEVCGIKKFDIGAITECDFNHVPTNKMTKIELEELWS